MGASLWTIWTLTMKLSPSLHVLGLLAATWITIAFAQSAGCKNNYMMTERYFAELSHKTIFTSPNYPSRYDNYAYCLWVIQTQPSYSSDYIVKVTFEEFELEDHDNSGICLYDSLKFYTGSVLSKRHLLGSYCSTDRPDVIYSMGRHLYVKFQTDLARNYKGFKFYYTAVHKEEASGICRPPYSGNVLTLAGSSGTFFSPDYPVPYPIESTCVWHITVPTGKVVKLTFESFSLLTQLKACLEVRDSFSSTGKEIGSSGNCESNTPGLSQSVYSSGEHMFVKFQSVGSVTNQHDKGFRASFKAVDPPVVSSKELCFPGNALNNNLMLSGFDGTLKSPPKYPTGLSCTWLISVPEKKIVRLVFSKFDMNWHAGNCGDYVEVFDGQYTSSERLKYYCAYEDPLSEVIRSSGRYMTVMFKADYRPRFYEGPNQRNGFVAQFSAVEKSDPTVIVIGVVFGVVVSIMIVVVCVAVKSKRKRTLNRETRAARIPMATTTFSAAHDTQPPPPEVPAVNPSPAPEVGYAPVPAAPPPPVYPYPLESPPPYPGFEGAPQYPPPGESYPWLQSNAEAKPPVSTADL